ncbi:UDP-glucose 4-epimerase GalE [Comamonas koreensis]|uniref:UDP-glucose 4-epimerase n=1 Tax=Comamonas koreensis TaxID=160825 RepID=A0AAW4XQU4_9BURK|nr:UDP-glucose 4-epimerase GalE [Comamonas koreensis]MCD2163697.1 UDP-glucose 4-epimerase GalE [Comamonas koreensis]
MILVTGGAGYVGSHICVALAEAGVPFLILDNFSNARRSVITRLGKILGFAPPCIDADVRDVAVLEQLFDEQHFDAVIHSAFLTASADAAREPLRYYDNNVSGTIGLLRAMQTAGLRNLVVSSSSVVYGDPAPQAVREDAPLSASTPYGQTALMVEQVLSSLDEASPKRWRMALLRSFNAVGCHDSGLIAEDPPRMSSHVAPYLAQVAAGKRDGLRIYGGDYPTPDGTPVRDYLHVMDLARAYVATLPYLRSHPGLSRFNIGSGQPTSVLGLVRAFEHANGRAVPFRIGARRAGDAAHCWADISRARNELGWQPQLGLDRMMEDVWRWQIGTGRSVH